MEKDKNFFQKVCEKINNLSKLKKIILLIICILIIVLVIFGIFSLLKGKKGSTSVGNINNKGMADISGNNVYFYYQSTNIEDGSMEKQGLYKTSGKKFELLDKVSSIRSINVSGNWVYYVYIDEADYHREIVKIKKNGKDRKVLVNDINIDIENNRPFDGAMFVIGDKIYFSGTGNKIEVVDKDGKNRKQITDEEVRMFQVEDDSIYYLNTSYELMKISTNGENASKVGDLNLTSFQVVKDKIYYVDMNTEYLKKMNLDGKNSEDVIKAATKFYNITDGYIYYFKTNEENKNSIYKKKLNGDEGESKVVDIAGTFTNICVVGNWIYYIDNVEDNSFYYTIYRVKTDGKDKEVIKVD